MTTPDISVVICTRDRAKSLQETLTRLTAADRRGLCVEVLVVDNGGRDGTPQVVAEFSEGLNARLLAEPTQGHYGKSHALNRALKEPNLGHIIAILDDDMSPHREWFQGIVAICQRWPEKDLFTGRSYVEWPPETPRAVAQSSELRTWMYSVIDNGNEDKAMGNGRWFSGNHFWFRSRCLASGIQFDDVWLTEPKFMLDLVEQGYGAVSGPDAIAGHRIQDQLLTKPSIRDRAIKVGRSNAAVRLRPFRRSVKHAVQFHRHPITARMFCGVKIAQWACIWLWSHVRRSGTERFVSSVIALQYITYHLKLLEEATEIPEYRILRRLRR